MGLWPAGKKISLGSSMRLTVRQEECQGHALCEGLAPDLFEVSEVDGKVRALLSELTPDRIPDARAAADHCPERAISLDE